MSMNLTLIIFCSGKFHLKYRWNGSSGWSFSYTNSILVHCSGCTSMVNTLYIDCLHRILGAWPILSLIPILSFIGILSLWSKTMNKTGQETRAGAEARPLRNAFYWLEPDGSLLYYIPLTPIQVWHHLHWTRHSQDHLWSKQYLTDLFISHPIEGISQ